jgi:hypothetical protein
MKKFPKEIVVTLENEGKGEDEFLSIHDNAALAAEHGVKKRGAVYVLKETICIEGVAKITPGK